MPAKNKATNFEMLMPALITLNHQVQDIEITCADPKLLELQYKIYSLIQDAIDNSMPPNSRAED